MDNDFDVIVVGAGPAGCEAAITAKKCGHEVVVYEKGTVPEEREKHPDLPRIIYVCMNITQGLLHDTYVYGSDIRPPLPTLLHPNEVLDGAIHSLL